MHRKTFIQPWRKYRDLTQEQLADAIGMSPGNLSKLENGHIPYTQQNLETIAEALNCGVVDLLTRDPRKDPVQPVIDLIRALPESTQKQALALIRTLREVTEAAEP